MFLLYKLLQFICLVKTSDKPIKENYVIKNELIILGCFKDLQSKMLTLNKYYSDNKTSDGSILDIKEHIRLCIEYLEDIKNEITFVINNEKNRVYKNNSYIKSLGKFLKNKHDSIVENIKEIINLINVNNLNNDNTKNFEEAYNLYTSNSSKCFNLLNKN